jgi:hypothetical protein
MNVSGRSLRRFWMKRSKRRTKQTRKKSRNLRTKERGLPDIDWQAFFMLVITILRG